MKTTAVPITPPEYAILHDALSHYSESMEGWGSQFHDPDAATLARYAAGLQTRIGYKPDKPPAKLRLGYEDLEVLDLVLQEWHGILEGDLTNEELAEEGGRADLTRGMLARFTAAQKRAFRAKYREDHPASAS